MLHCKSRTYESLLEGAQPFIRKFTFCRGKESSDIFFDSLLLLPSTYLFGLFTIFCSDGFFSLREQYFAARHRANQSTPTAEQLGSQSIFGAFSTAKCNWRNF